MSSFHFRRPVFIGAALFLAVAAAEAASTFPAPFDTERAAGGPMPALEAAAKIELPAGFRATLFAGEPDVRQPIAMTTDARGRLWVAENYTYSERTVGFHPDLRDRILIFEDTDNDGRFDRRTVFWEGAQRLTSIEVGLAGVWAICLPNLVFIPDRDGDDVPDAAPEVLLDGFEFAKGHHNVANGLRWGPDGWLYGRQGILAQSLVGPPGASVEQRTPTNVGIWRYHPSRRTFELVAEGTTNPWGMDWDANGELFFINTVIGHLWHAIPGAHFRRTFGEDPNPRVYESIEQHADHVHWATGEKWTDVRKGVTDDTLAAGGGHAHTGLLIYQGGQWPAAWYGKLLTINFHGRRFNVERLERDGSGFIGRREPDVFLFPDKRFRGLDLIAAPDGGVFVSDWNDDGECHDLDGIHRSSGRIFKLIYGEPRPRGNGDLARLTGVELARFQRNENDWLARQSRRVLADRAALGVGVAEAHAELRRMVADEPEPVHRLRALWALHVSGGGVDELAPALLLECDEYIRVWAIRLMTEVRARALTPQTLSEFERMAMGDASARVRLALASALQRLPVLQRVPLAAALLEHGEDAGDHNLPLMIWYGIEPVAAAAGGHFERLLAEARIPRVQRLGARRLAEEIDTAPERIDALLQRVAATAAPIANRQAVLDGLAQGFSGRRKAPKPPSWDAVSATLAAGADDALRNRIRDLSALFGDGRALEEIRAVALDPGADVPQRRAALQVLVDARAPGLRELCEELLKVRDLAAKAAAGLAVSDDGGVADVLLAAWPTTYGQDRLAVMNVLISRPTWAAKMLDAMAAGVVARASLTSFQVRQIRLHNVPALSRQLEQVWGRQRDEAGNDRAAALAKWEAQFTPDRLALADKTRGRAVFRSLCAACHTLNGEGGVIGPDLTGAARDNLSYLLENLLFPSAVVAEEQRLTTLTLKDGRVLAGMVRARAPTILKLQTLTELVALPIDEVAKEETSAVSLMPPGLLDSVDPAQARDLVAYLMAKELPSP